VTRIVRSPSPPLSLVVARLYSTEPASRADAHANEARNEKALGWGGEEICTLLSHLSPVLADTSRYTYSGKPTGCGISLLTTDWRYVYFISAISPISITYQFSSAAALLLARLSLSLVTSRRPLLLLLLRHSPIHHLLLLRLRLLPLALMVLHWPLIKVLGVLDMTTPPPSSSATVSRHHMITR